MKAGVAIRVSLGLALLVAPLAGCFLNTRGTPITYDADLRGCFETPSDAGRNRIVVQQPDVNLLTGHGEGLSELGPGESEVWTFVGDIRQTGPAPLEGVGALYPTWRTSSGLIESPTLDLIRERIAPTHDKLILQRTDGPGVVRLELFRCS
jgi:hypothetical protein